MRLWSFFSVITNRYLSNFPMCIMENVSNLSFTSLNWFSAVSNLLFRWWFLINQLCFLSVHSSLISDCFFLIRLLPASGFDVLSNIVEKANRKLSKAVHFLQSVYLAGERFLLPLRWPLSSGLRQCLRIGSPLCRLAGGQLFLSPAFQARTVPWAFI